MTLNLFITKWTGKPCDFDQGGTYECVDLIRQKIQEVDGLPGYSLHALGSKGGAKDLFNNFNSTDAIHFTKITNTPLGIPKPGNIVVFKTSTWFPFLFGLAGHTGIVVTANVNTMVIFNQNYLKGHVPCLTTFTYKDCLGWIATK